MAVSQQLLTQLEAHGVSQSHLEALLAVLRLQRNGSWSWNYVNGHLTQCDLRVVIPSREREVQRVTEGVVSVLRHDPMAKAGGL